MMRTRCGSSVRSRPGRRWRSARSARRCIADVDAGMGESDEAVGELGEVQARACGGHRIRPLPGHYLFGSPLLDKQPCPLCQKERPAKKFQPLYLTPVCHKCYHGFARRRQLAFLIDMVLWWVVMYAFLFLVGGSIVISWGLLLLFICKDGFTGCSLGKEVCGVQVIDRVTLQPIGFGTSFKRNLPLIIPIVPLIVALKLGPGPRDGDGWAKTKVIWSKHRGHPIFRSSTYCPQCQHDLRGNTSGVCPGCGWRIDENTMQSLSKEPGEPIDSTSG